MAAMEEVMPRVAVAAQATVTAMGEEEVASVVEVAVEATLQQLAAQAALTGEQARLQAAHEAQAEQREAAAPAVMTVQAEMVAA